MKEIHFYEGNVFSMFGCSLEQATDIEMHLRLYFRSSALTLDKRLSFYLLFISRAQAYTL